MVILAEEQDEKKDISSLYGLVCDIFDSNPGMAVRDECWVGCLSCNLQERRTWCCMALVDANLVAGSVNWSANWVVCAQYWQLQEIEEHLVWGVQRPQN